MEQNFFILVSDKRFKLAVKKSRDTFHMKERVESCRYAHFKLTSIG